MGLTKKDMEFIKEHLAEWLLDASAGKPPVVYEIELRGRFIRVEEELKHQRDLMKRGFDLMEKRFESVDKRFETIDRRFEEMRDDMNKRFEYLTRRIDSFMKWTFAQMITVGAAIVASLKYLLTH